MSAQALILVDVQNDYFPGGKWTLHRIDEAAANIRRVLDDARSRGLPVFHVRHEYDAEDASFFVPGTPGAEIHPSVAPLDGEPTILKHHVNSFRGTDLKDRLDAAGVTDVTIVGAMSHMCIDSAVRAAADFGYEVTVIEDACASRDLEFNNVTIPAMQVHAAFFSVLATAFARVTTTDEYLSDTGR